jgi:hypothetical protein
MALCNGLYKIMEKLITIRLKPFLDNDISQEKFSFVKGHLIHEAIGYAHEGIHSIKGSSQTGFYHKN